jgi:hypothetical protein
MQGTTERINDTLARYCSNGYGAGIYGEANIDYLLDNFRDLIYIQAVYRLGDMAQLATPIKDSRKFGELLEALASLEDYPLFDDDYLNHIQEKYEDAEWARIEADYSLDPDVASEVRCSDNGDYYFELSGDYVYPAFDEDEFALLVRTKSQTWAVHYEGKQYHEPTVCAWCQDDSLATPL